MADSSQVEQLRLEDFTVDEMARRITDFWGKGNLCDPIADHARSKGAAPGSAVPGDGSDGNTSGKTFLPYLPRTGANGKGSNGHYTFEEFYPLEAETKAQLEAETKAQPKNWLTFLHPADREFLGLDKLKLSDSESDSAVLEGAVNEMELPSFVADKNAQEYRDRLVKFLQYLNGDPEAKYGGALYPSVAQPFMGDLHNPKVLVVTFNPAFHEFSDWALGATEDQLAEATSQKLRANKELFDDQVHSRQQWIRQQDDLLKAITGKDVFVPWQLADETVPNFAFDPPLNCHGEKMSQWKYEADNTKMNGNWHTHYFRVSCQDKSPAQPKHIRDLIPQEVDSCSAGLAQVEIFPYATKDSNDLEQLVTAFQKNYTEKGFDLYSKFRADLWPSQRPILDYILATLLTASENGTIIICRSSVENKNYWPAVLEIAGAFAEVKGLTPDSLQARCFVFSGTATHLTLGNIRRYTPKPTAQDIADLLQSH